MLKQFARNLRYRQTAAEQKLWSLLRNRQLHGHKFRRQHVIERYIVDFSCVTKKLIIELDGGTHIILKTKDAIRTVRLRNLGFTVLRYKNEDVLTNMHRVLRDIEKHLEIATPHSSLSPTRGERIRNDP